MKTDYLPRETKDLTREELECIYTLMSTAVTKNFLKHLALSPNVMKNTRVLHYIYKSEDGEWITCTSDKTSNYPRNIKVFDNVMDACKDILDRNSSNVIGYFNTSLEYGISDNVLNIYAANSGYKIIPDNTYNFGKDVNNFISMKKKEISMLTDQCHDAITMQAIADMLRSAYNNIKKNEPMPFKILYGSTNLYEGVENNYEGYKISVEKFANLFGDDECLKLDVIEEKFYNKDFIFLLDDQTIFVINARHYPFHGYPAEPDIVLAATVHKIDYLKGNNFIKAIYAGDPYYCTDDYYDKDAFKFVDSHNKSILNEYESTDTLKSYEGKDIREILKPISFEEFFDRLTHYDEVKGHSKSNYCKKKIKELI